MCGTVLEMSEGTRPGAFSVPMLGFLGLIVGEKPLVFFPAYLTVFI